MELRYLEVFIAAKEMNRLFILDWVTSSRLVLFTPLDLIPHLFSFSSLPTLLDINERSGPPATASSKADSKALASSLRSYTWVFEKVLWFEVLKLKKSKIIDFFVGQELAISHLRSPFRLTIREKLTKISLAFSFSPFSVCVSVCEKHMFWVGRRNPWRQDFNPEKNRFETSAFEKPIQAFKKTNP